MFPNDPRFLCSDIYCITVLHIWGRCTWWWICAPALGAKFIICWEKHDELMGQVAHHTVTSLTLSKQGNLDRSVSLYMADVKICCVRRAKEGCVCFAALGQGATYTLLLSLVLLVGEVQCRESKVHLLFTLSLVQHDQYPSNCHCFQIWLLNRSSI